MNAKDPFSRATLLAGAALLAACATPMATSTIPATADARAAVAQTVGSTLAPPRASTSGAPARDLPVPAPPAERSRASVQSRARAPMTALQALLAANAEARQRPHDATFVAARQVYAYLPGGLYELHASPGFVTTILLEPGERLTDIAAGDTTRWMVSEAETETESEARAIVLVKPGAAGLKTNIVLITDRRTYLIDAFSHAGAAYAAQISWSYPAPPAPKAHVVAAAFDYRIRTARGGAPRWKPSRVFDDGRRTFIVFPDTIATSEMPPLFIVTDEGGELANYRIDGAQMIVDRLFDVAELRLGARRPVVVRIERKGLSQRRASAGGGR